MIPLLVLTQSQDLLMTSSPKAAFFLLPPGVEVGPYRTKLLPGYGIKDKFKSLTIQQMYLSKISLLSSTLIHYKIIIPSIRMVRTPFREEIYINTYPMDGCTKAVYKNIQGSFLHLW